MSILSAQDHRPKDTRLRGLYPFETRRCRIGDYGMNYVDEGSGDPVLMVHGNPTWSFYWRRLIGRLRGQYRAIAIDHIGCGLSDKPIHYSYTLNQHIDNLCCLVDQLDLKRATLVAHDWGGAIGLGMLLRRRDCFKRIVLFNTGAFPPPYIPLRIRICRIPLIGKIGVQGFNLFARAALAMATEQPGGLEPDVAHGYLAPYDSWNHRVAIHRFVKDIPGSRSHASWQILSAIESGLPELGSMPIQLIWGMKDWCFRPDCLDRFVGYWPNAQVHRIINAGHYVVEDAAQEVPELVAEFLQNHKV